MTCTEMVLKCKEMQKKKHLLVYVDGWTVQKACYMNKSCKNH